MKKAIIALSFALTLLAIPAFSACSAVKPQGTYTFDEVSVTADIWMQAELEYQYRNEMESQYIKLNKNKTGIISLPPSTGTAAITWKLDGKIMTISTAEGVENPYGNAIIFYNKVGRKITITVKKSYYNTHSSKTEEATVKYTFSKSLI